jgi:uncharacterized protein YfeS
VAKIIHKLLELEPQLTKKQATGFYHNTFKKQLKDLLEEADKKNVANILYDLATTTSTTIDVAPAVDVATITGNITATEKETTSNKLVSGSEREQGGCFMIKGSAGSLYRLQVVLSNWYQVLTEQ